MSYVAYNIIRYAAVLGKLDLGESGSKKLVDKSAAYAHSRIKPLMKAKDRSQKISPIR